MFSDGVASLPLIANSSDVTTQNVRLQQTSIGDVSIDDIPVGSPLSPGNQRVGGEPRVFTFDVPQPRDREFKNITCFIMMLDVITQQVRVQQTPAHAGVVLEEVNEQMLGLMTSMMQEPWEGQHTCGSEASTACDHCTLTAQWFNLAGQVSIEIHQYLFLLTFHRLQVVKSAVYTSHSCLHLLQVVKFVSAALPAGIPEKDLPSVDEATKSQRRNPATARFTFRLYFTYNCMFQL